MPEDTAQLLAGAAGGDRQCAEALIAHVHQELRELAAQKLQSERPGHTLQPTALVNEAYLRLLGQTHVHWRDKGHFLAVAANLMRRILIDHARKRRADKRGGTALRLDFDEDILLSENTDPLDLIALDDVMNELAQLNARHARIVELRYFAGLNIEETAEAIGVSPATVKSDWRVARAWLAVQFSSERSA